MPADLLALLRDHLRLPLSDRVFAAIDRLQGRRIGSLQFWGQAREVADNLDPWIPIHILPLGTVGGHRRFGFHLNEPCVARGELPIVGIWKHRQEPPNILEKANSLGDFVLRALIDLEIDGERDACDIAIAEANGAFGEDFHRRGRFPVSERDRGARVLHQLGRAPVDHYNEALAHAGDHSADPRDLLAEGIERHPDCLHLHALMAQVLDGRDEVDSAARHGAASLGCYHHTSLHETISLEEHYQRCASLARRRPDAFGPATHDAIALRGAGDRARMQHTMGLFAAGEVRAAERTLADMCWDLQDYSNELIVKVLRKHYEVLDWAWAQALCDLRALVV